MRFKSMSAEEAREANAFEPWPDGEYDFIIDAAADTLSRAGDDMLKLTLHVFNRAGAKRTVFDYILGTDSWQWKLRHLSEAIGMVADYERGELIPHKLVGKPGRVKLRTNPAKDGYPASNGVADYLVPAGASRAEPTSRQKAMAGGNVDDDEIPF